MTTLSVTDLHVSWRGANNGQPLGGWATFSDGKAYDWMRLPDGLLCFHAYHRGRGGRSVRFYSVKRARVLATALEAI